MLLRIASPLSGLGVKPASCSAMTALQSSLASWCLRRASSHLNRHKSSSARRSILGHPERTVYQGDEEKGPPLLAKNQPPRRFCLRRASLNSLLRRKRRESHFDSPSLRIATV